MSSKNSEKLDINPSVILNTVHQRIIKDLSDASKYVSLLTLVGMLELIKSDMTMQIQGQQLQELQFKKDDTNAQ